MSTKHDEAARRRELHGALANESELLIRWVVVGLTLCSLHVLQWTLLGQDWKDDMTGWAYVDRDVLGSGTLLASVFVLAISCFVMLLAILYRSSHMLWAVAVLSAARLVLVARSASQANGGTMDSRFGVGMSVALLILAVLVSAAAAIVLRGRE